MSLKREKYRYDRKPKALIIPLFLSMSVCLTISFSGCKTGSGCKTSEQYQVKTDKHGSLSMKRGKTNLFDKKTQKKRKSRRG